MFASTRLTASEWDAVLIALSYLLAGETDEFDANEVEAARRALDKLQRRALAQQEKGRPASAGRLDECP